MTPPPAGPLVVVDLGKTRCRVEVRSEDGSRAALDGDGAPGLAADEGLPLALASIAPLLPAASASIVIGAAGALAAPDASSTLAALLAESTGASVAVTSDVVTAHAGAFGGSAGTLLIAGTGSVAFQLDATGVLRRTGGWGPWLGDEGSGQWIGRRGLAAVLAAADGRGPATDMTASAATLTGGEDIASWVSDGEPAARMARFAPSVLEHADAGDPLARSIVRDALDELACLAATAGTDAGAPTRIAGGLTDSPSFFSALLAALHDRGIVASRAEGTALDGAALLSADRTLPHERYVHRA